MDKEKLQGVVLAVADVQRAVLALVAQGLSDGPDSDLGGRRRVKNLLRKVENAGFTLDQIINSWLLVAERELEEAEREAAQPKKAR